MRENRETLLSELAEVGVERFTASDYRSGLVTHIVLLRFAQTVSQSTRLEVRDRFLALIDSERDGRSYIASIAGGEQLSGEPDNRFDAAFVLTFDSLGDRNFYVGEPIVADSRHFDVKHEAFKRFLSPHVTAVEVVDFVG